MYFRHTNTQPVSAIPWSKYTHVIQFVLWPTYNGTTGACGLDVNSYSIAADGPQFVAGAHANGVKALIGITEGPNAGASGKSAMQTCTDPAHIGQFVSTIAAYVNNNNYDGFDIDWEGGIISSQYADFIQRLRAAIPRPKLLTAAVVWNERSMFAQQQGNLDQINYMNYDNYIFTVSGNYSSTTVYNSSLYNASESQWVTAENEFYYMVTSAGISPAKMGLGIPFYGRVIKGCLSGYGTNGSCSRGVTGPNQTWASSGFGNGNSAGAISYPDLLRSTYWSNGNYVWDAAHGAEYISYDSSDATQDAFVSFTGPAQIREAVNFVKAKGYGGVMTFEAVNEYDGSASGDSRYPLSTALYNAMGGSTAPAATAPTITTASLPSGVVGTPYSQTLTADGTSPITWSIAGGSLPSGLTLSSTGVISGTPSAAVNASFTVQASNSAGTNSKNLTIAIAAAVTAPSITTSSLPSGVTGTPYSQTLTATGTTPITWSLTGGALPSGLTLSSTGVISGTPSAAMTASFTVQASNSAGSNSKALSLTIAAPPTTPPATGTDTEAPSVQLTSPSTNVALRRGATLTLTASATDNVGVVTVQYRLDGVVIGTGTGTTWAYDWATILVRNNGWHILDAVAVDAAGNSSVSQGVRVRVQ